MKAAGGNEQLLKERAPKGHSLVPLCKYRVSGGQLEGRTDSELYRHGLLLTKAILKH